jgi:hypothetical protein
VGVALGRPLEQPDKVLTLDHERPRDWDQLERLGWYVSLPSVIRTPLTGAYYVSGFGYGNRPVEALPECVLDKCAWCSVMAAHALVDVLKQLSPLLNGITALQDSSGTPLIEFPIH